MSLHRGHGDVRDLFNALKLHHAKATLYGDRTPCISHAHHACRLKLMPVPDSQAVSSRPDVIPPGYLSELEKLQDQIPPFPDADAYALISAEMGAPARSIFADLSASPIAAASLGQVRHSLSQLPGNSWHAPINCGHVLDMFLGWEYL